MTFFGRYGIDIVLTIIMVLFMAMLAITLSAAFNGSFWFSFAGMLIGFFGASAVKMLIRRHRSK